MKTKQFVIKSKMSKEPFGRLDSDAELRERLLPFCRLKSGEVWEDRVKGHRVGVLDATNQSDIDQKEHFQPMPDFMIIAYFNVASEYTDILKILRGKILRGYYKEAKGEKTENLARSKSENILAGNVSLDVQQVFYRMHENVPGCYAQKPIKAIERIVKASSREDDIITDFFSHSGTTLIVGELMNRRVFTMDNELIFAELAICHLEHLRKTGALGWQYQNPFPEINDFLVEKSLLTNHALT